MQMLVSNMQDALQVTIEIEDLVQKVLSTAAHVEKVSSEAEVSIAFVSNDYIKELNRVYRGKDAVTDVLSFALNEQLEEEPDGFEENMLGDIVISLERAEEQAVNYGHSFEREVAFLALHGFLHLLGYDHMEEEDERNMRAKQDEILGLLEITR